MTGKVIFKIDKRPHCGNGWGPTSRWPGCDYTGGHHCDLLADHEGQCRCVCGSKAAHGIGDCVKGDCHVATLPEEVSDGRR